MQLARDLALLLKLLLTGLFVAPVGIIASLVIGTWEAAKNLWGFACFIVSSAAADWKGRHR